MGTQLDRGLYGALIIDDPKEPLAYHDEWVVILDDWLDDVTATPPDVLTELSTRMADMSGMKGKARQLCCPAELSQWTSTPTTRAGGSRTATIFTTERA